MKFRKLGIIDPIAKAIAEHKLEDPSEIQDKAIPPVLEGKDIIAGSATGSGKTLVFASGIIQNCEKGKGIQALILTPTRELTVQITKEILKFSKYKHLNVFPIYGGVAISPQIDALRIADVIVGTPGRLMDHMERRTINLSRVKILVLDEADRMLDMGFQQDVESIISQCPPKRQTLLFSATISEDIVYLSRKYMKSPIKISAGVQVDPTKLKQCFYEVPDNMKFSLLVHMITTESTGLVMVFCNSRKTTDFVTNNLRQNDIDAQAIHGGFTQNKRERTMEKFHHAKAHVLVCTDVASRGLDIKNVSHIYNYDIPRDSKDYIHRIGRTARAGEAGKAINLLCQKDYENFGRIERDYRLTITKEQLPIVPRIPIKWRETSGGYSSDSRGPRRFGPRRSGPRGQSNSFGSRRSSSNRGSFGRR
ncbi:MAG: DEAD/DEAH box helicase [Nanoarchaeota archaeon]|nr:DEAD/DEAH box helicase [Nanoarchaeota archaeon]